MKKTKIKTQVIKGITWTTELPKEAGDYWFYGYRYGRISCGREKDPEWMVVKVRKCANGFMMVANGQFMYAAEIEDAWFAPFILPQFPELKGKS
jgi:hypothetical protein